MRTILLLIIMVNFHIAKSLTYTVTACSFADSSVVQYGSTQWIDTKSAGGYTSGDRFNIYIFQMVGNQTTSTYTIVLDKPYWSYYPTLPMNPDGSRRAYFTMPTTFPAGKFQLSVYLTPFSLRYGFFPLTTGIKEVVKLPKEIKQVNFYDMNGRKTEKPSGLHIRETVFTDETVHRSKYYLVEE